MSPILLLAAAAGLALGLGLWTLVGRLPRLAAPRLSRRIAAAVADVSADAREYLRARHAEPSGVAVALLAPLADRGALVIRAFGGGDDALARAIRQAGASDTGIRAHRVRQLAVATAATAAGLGAAVLLVRGGGHVVLAVTVVVLAMAFGVALPDWLLARRVARRRRRIEVQLPVILDLVVLGLTAGTGVDDAIARAADAGGDLAAELRLVRAHCATGVPLPAALERMAAELEMPSVTRSIEHLVSALDRGAPVADVLRAHADDARDEERQRLTERAGTQEVAMLVPLVLLILPVTVLFALAPAALVLDLG